MAQCVTSDYAVRKTFHHTHVKPEYLKMSRKENELHMARTPQTAMQNLALTILFLSDCICSTPYIAACVCKQYVSKLNISRKLRGARSSLPHTVCHMLS